MIKTVEHSRGAQATRTRPREDSLPLDPAQWGFPSDTDFIALEEPTEGERAHYGRSKWPPGPWDKEPFDKIVWVDPATNLDCMLIRGPMGQLNGYVGVSEGHPWFGRGYAMCVHPEHKAITQKTEVQKWRRKAVLAKDAKERENYQSLAKMTASYYTPRTKCGYEHSIESALNVHGGVTYSDFCKPECAVCHEAKPERPERIWWFAFDTAHFQDVCPGMLASSIHMHEIIENEWQGYEAGGGPKPTSSRDLFTDHLNYDPEANALRAGGFLEGSYKTVAYVKEKTESMAQQLAAVEKQ